MTQQVMYPYDLIQGYHKLTLPTAGAAEIKYPAIKTYVNPEFFHLNNAGDGVIFKAPSLGGTTSNSSNTRSELRELKPDGSLASWSTSVGTHSMECEFSVDVLPYPKKPHVVTGQIHDGSDDVTVFRVEGNPDRLTATIWITDGNTTHGRKLTDAYRIGDRYRVGFYVSNGAISYTFNGKIIIGYTQVKKKTGCYFKAGCYNQDGGDTTPGVYAQVTIYAVQVCHDGVCTGNAPVVVDPPPVVTPPTPPTVPDVATALLHLETAGSSLTNTIATLTTDLELVGAAIKALKGGQ